VINTRPESVAFTIREVYLYMGRNRCIYIHVIRRVDISQGVYIRSKKNGTLHIVYVANATTIGLARGVNSSFECTTSLELPLTSQQTKFDDTQKEAIKTRGEAYRGSPTRPGGPVDHRYETQG
jgi:hypothetical protein